MRHLPNIEKSGLRRGEYVGYANGVWHIRKDRYRGWHAWKCDEASGYVTRDAPTLAHMSVLLAAYVLAHPKG